MEHRLQKSSRHLLNICGDAQYGRFPATPVDCPLTHTQITRLLTEMPIRDSGTARL
jgi:hypothetical protein